MRPILMLVLGLTTPDIAHAQEEARPPQRIRSVPVEDRQSCPTAVGDEIVVCYRADEPFRIPKRFRHTEIAAENQSWANRAATIDEVGRVAGGLPNTCSPIGTGGQTGCTQAMLRTWFAERRAMAQEAESIP